MTSSEDIVIIGAGPAGRAAAAMLRTARVIAHPEATAWHAEAGRVWIETECGVQSVPFARLLLCADEPLLLLALGCAFLGARPVVDATGATSAPGIYAAGRVLGAATPEEATRQARIAAASLAGVTPEGEIRSQPESLPDAERLDPLGIAQLLERPPGPERNRAAIAQTRARGGHLTGLVAPACPVGFAALAAMAPSMLVSRGPQPDAASLHAERAP